MYRRRKGHNLLRNRAQSAARAMKAGMASARNADDEESVGDTPDWRALMREGAALLNQGRALEAAHCFCRAADRRPDDVPTVQQLGAALLRADEPERALAWFNEGLAFEPDHPGLLHGKGLACAALNKRDRALDAFRDATRSDPDAWRSWQSIADLTPDEDERLGAIAEAADALGRLCLEPAAKTDWFARCATALIQARRMDDAVRFVERNFQRFASARIAHDALARAHYRGGAFEAAFFHKERALQVLAPDDVPAKPRQSRFDPAAAIIALRDVLAVLDAAGARPFLCAGTLLGFIREGAPLPHDRDVDIGLLRAPDGTPDIAAIVREHPDLMLARDARPGDRYFALWHGGIGIDLFLHDVRSGHLLCGLSDWPGDIQWRFTTFGIKDAAFGELHCRIPSEPERYLEETYGPRWRRPDTGFASAISSPALFEVSPYARAFYSVARAGKSLRAGDRAKAAALIAQSPILIDSAVLTRTRPGAPESPSSAQGSRS